MASMTAAQPDGRRQRHLDDDAIDLGVGVELVDGTHDGGLGRLAFELDEGRLDADLGAAAQDLLEVDGRRGVAPDDHHGQAGRPSLGLREGRRRPPRPRSGSRWRWAPPRADARPGGSPISLRATRGSASRGSPLPTASWVSDARRSTSCDQVHDPGHHRSLDIRIADRWQVDHHVGGRPSGRRLGQQGRHVQVARRVDVAASGQRLGRRHELEARLDAQERDLGRVARGRGQGASCARPAGRPCRAAASSRSRTSAKAAASSSASVRNRSARVRPVSLPRPAGPRAARTSAGPWTASRPSPRGPRRGWPRPPRHCRRPGPGPRRQLLDEAVEGQIAEAAGGDGSTARLYGCGSVRWVGAARRRYSRANSCPTSRGLSLKPPGNLT